MKSLSLMLAALLAGVCAATTPARADDPASDAERFSCADETVVERRPEDRGELAQVRELRPSAGARTSAELYAHARYAGLAYDLYDVFDADGDPRAAFAAPGLELIALIYGEPGRSTERRRREGRSRTLYGFVADEPASGRRYVVFRGTQVPAEWARNAQFGQRPFPSGARRWSVSERVHAGFLQIFDSLELDGGPWGDDFAEGLAAIVAAPQTVFVGHSLGGALATLAGVEAARRDGAAAERVEVVTLASPRVGNEDFATLAEDLVRIDRVCNLVDAVPAVPFSTQRIRYVHAGTLHAVSSFDWPELANDLDAGDQVGCWHGHNAYEVMLEPTHPQRLPEACFVTSE